jgi:hypothetical protein
VHRFGEERVELAPTSQQLRDERGGAACAVRLALLPPRTLPSPASHEANAVGLPLPRSAELLSRPVSQERRKPSRSGAFALQAQIVRDYLIPAAARARLYSIAPEIGARSGSMGRKMLSGIACSLALAAIVVSLAGAQVVATVPGDS